MRLPNIHSLVRMQRREQAVSMAAELSATGTETKGPSRAPKRGMASTVWHVDAVRSPRSQSMADRRLSQPGGFAKPSVADSWNNRSVPVVTVSGALAHYLMRLWRFAAAALSTRETA